MTGAPSTEHRTPNTAWFLRGVTLLVLLLLGWGVGALLRGPRAEGWPPRAQSHGRLRVLTSIFPLYDFARQVGGPDVEVRNLLPPGVDPHEYALSPRDVQTVAGADLIIANGAGLDDFLTAALDKAQSEARVPVVRCAEGLPGLRLGAEGHDHGVNGGEQAGVDPHMWLDPVRARAYVRRIADAIAAQLERRQDPAAARAVAAVRQRAAAYDAQLVQLDAAYRLALAPAARSGAQFIAFHGAFAYLAARYGLTVAAVWQPTPGREPSPREVAAILRLARQDRVRALFSEPQFSPRAIEMIAHDARLPVYVLDPVETAADFRTGGYLPAMRRNLAALVRALTPPRARQSRLHGMPRAAIICSVALSARSQRACVRCSPKLVPLGRSPATVGRLLL